jgi:lipopolysaccharide export system protein LptC
MAIAAMGNHSERKQGLVLDDRSLEFRRARRHSVLVRILKAVLPLMAAGILSLYVIPSFLSHSIDEGRGRASVKAITIEAGALKMLQPRVKGVNERQEAYDIVADSATQAARNADVMYLEKIRGKLTGQDGKITTLTAPDGIHNNKTEEMRFEHGAVVNREPGMVATFKTGTAYMKQQLLISKTPVTVRLHESTIEADGMTLYWGEQRAVFEGNVRTHVERQPVQGASSSGREAQPTLETGFSPAATQNR